MIKRIVPLFALCLFALLLAACVSNPASSQPTVDANTQLLWEMRELRNHIDQFKAVFPATTASTGSSAPMNERSIIESIIYTRKSGRIVVVYHNDGDPPPPAGR